MQEISKVYQLPKPESKDDRFTYKSLLDNCASTLGKIIYYCKNKLSENDIIILIENWYSKLPIKKDMKEAKISYEILMELLNSKPEYVL